MGTVAVIDYGVGNLRSVEKAFASAGCNALVSTDKAVLCEADALVLPGVGAFGACMKAICECGFDQLIIDRASKGTPILGVCVGMQMLFEESEEFGRTHGLGLLTGGVRRFSNELLVPQVGWNQVLQTRRHSLLEGIDDGAYFYFVHSFFCEPADRNTIVAETEYGSRYASVVGKQNIYGVQFHPEKSQAAGLRLLGNFARGLH
jgi:glutamine amidotransferase